MGNLAKYQRFYLLERSLQSQHYLYSLHFKTRLSVPNIGICIQNTYIIMLIIACYLTVILRTRVVYELKADEVRSTELAIRHIRREWVESVIYYIDNCCITKFLVYGGILIVNLKNRRTYYCTVDFAKSLKHCLMFFKLEILINIYRI